MKAIILAAGRGSRMGNLTDELPKCFVSVGGMRLIDRQIKSLRQAGIKDIAIVTGYKADSFTSEEVTYFLNSRWHETNMVSSLACAVEWLEQSTCIVSYSDIVYSSNVVLDLINCPGSLSISYDLDWLRLWSARFEDPLSDAETFKLHNDGTLKEIGKKTSSLSDIEGQYMGLLKFTPSGWKSVVEFFHDKNMDRYDMTSTLSGLVENGIRINTIAVNGGWCEIDSESDIEVFKSLEIKGL